jgi:hypothetical protein
MTRFDRNFVLLTTYAILISVIFSKKSITSFHNKLSQLVSIKTLTMFSEQERNQLQGILLKNDQLDYMCEFGNIADNVLHFPVHSKDHKTHR